MTSASLVEWLWPAPAQFEPSPHRAVPQPSPEGLPPCFAAGEYQGASRDFVLQYKRSGRAAACAASMLASALLFAADEAPALRGPGSLVLVPVPPTRPRKRGTMLDLMPPLARSQGALWATVLEATGGAEHKSLDARARWRSSRMRLGARPQRPPPGDVWLVDDVITTGATLVSASRALSEVPGWAPTGAIVLASAVLRSRARGTSP